MATMICEDMLLFPAKKILNKRTHSNIVMGTKMLEGIIEEYVRDFSLDEDPTFQLVMLTLDLTTQPISSVMNSFHEDDDDAREVMTIDTPDAIINDIAAMLWLHHEEFFVAAAKKVIRRKIHSEPKNVRMIPVFHLFRDEGLFFSFQFGK